MKSQPRLLLMFLVCMMCGCQSTTEVLTKKIPDKYIEVIQDDPSIDIEKTLQASGNEYMCKEIYYGKGSSKNRRACYIKAPEPGYYEKLGIRLIDAPLAMLKDTGVAILVVGEVMITYCIKTNFCISL